MHTLTLNSPMLIPYCLEISSLTLPQLAAASNQGDWTR